MKSKIILASVVSLTLAGAVPSLMAADRNETRVEARNDQNRIPYSQVPGEAKRAIEPNLNSGDKVTEAWKFNRGGRTIYVVTTNDERIIRADDKGNLISVKSTDEDTVNAGNNRVAVKYNNLPGRVKDTLGKEARGNPMEIWEVNNRDNRKIYVANIEENDGTRRVRVDNDGTLLEKPVFLSDTNDTRDRNSRIDNRDNQDDIDAYRRATRDRYRNDSKEIDWSQVPGNVKSAVGSEMGQNTKVGNVMKVNRNGNTVYRVELENETTARTLWVDDNGKLMKELNDTEEGRKRVEMSELPGNVKSAMINEAHGKEPKRIWQVTRGRDTFYVGEADDGHLVRIDDNGKVLAHDSNPNLLTNRNDNIRDNNTTAAERNRNRDNGRDNTPDRKYEKARDLDTKDLNKIKENEMPKAARDTVRENLKNGEKVSEVYKTKPENGNYHFIVTTSDDRVIRIGEHGGLLGQTR